MILEVPGSTPPRLFFFPFLASTFSLLRSTVHNTHHLPGSNSSSYHCPPIPPLRPWLAVVTAAADRVRKRLASWGKWGRRNKPQCAWFMTNQRQWAGER